MQERLSIGNQRNEISLRLNMFAVYCKTCGKGKITKKSINNYRRHFRESVQKTQLKFSSNPWLRLCRNGLLAISANPLREIHANPPFSDEAEFLLALFLF